MMRRISLVVVGVILAIFQAEYNLSFWQVLILASIILLIPNIPRSIIEHGNDEGK